MFCQLCHDGAGQDHGRRQHDARAGQTRDDHAKGRQSIQIHSVPVIWSSDIWSFRVYGQFLGGPNFAILYEIDHISRI